MEEFASSSSGAFPSTGRTEADPMEESFHLLTNKLKTGTYPDQTSFHLGEEGRPWFGDFPWSPQLQEMLKGRFGFHSFKGLQLGPINALLSGKDVKRLLDDLKLDSPATQILYITTVLQSLLHRSKLVVIGLDKAYLIPIWENDFRPDYKELKMLREWYPGVPIAAVTASATPEKGQPEKKSAHAMGGNFDVFCLEHQGGLMNEEGELGFWQPNLPRY
uniref:Uncharacterized protein n=2 Tax=Chromera velia CCMP2878 TaxID=1169474 RepID=A0A0G4GIM4_9ALVE|eukprot:Cvel_22003.t2-p1 / transcript=Cvel_22003.t2 / gene=Cvel_22003 / organism=Chromera_velia_CCMP2878 / gene_product=ATP-dependent DNA helicase Q5, putative / transcript_product=ATP-dependent DNA helicase Q5, putative / location=Cvel_scaffold2121:1383-6753(-) / protein_length=217 / sequence_SO=supercontig / SO=protein_coding / is_pseudo=false